jgi:hypothetical protein
MDTDLFWVIARDWVLMTAVWGGTAGRPTTLMEVAAVSSRVAFVHG